MENIELVSFIAKCCHLLPFMSLLYQKCWNQLVQNVQFLQKRTKLATFLFTSVTYQCQRLPGINCSSYLLISLFHYINHCIVFSAYLWHPKSNCEWVTDSFGSWYYDGITFTHKTRALEEESVNDRREVARFWCYCWVNTKTAEKNVNKLKFFLKLKRWVTITKENHLDLFWKEISKSQKVKF